jgi:hypothetical protein
LTKNSLIPGKYNSYASALSATIPPPTRTEVLFHSKRRSSAAATPDLIQAKEDNAKNQATISNLKHEATIEQLQAEIQTLKAYILGNTTPSDVTKISNPISHLKDTITADD